MSNYLSDEMLQRWRDQETLYPHQRVNMLLAELADTKAKLAEAERALTFIAKQNDNARHDGDLNKCTHPICVAGAALARIKRTEDKSNG